MLILKEWAISVVSACAVIAAVSFLAPSGINGKSLKVIAGLFTILCFVAPLTQLDIDTQTKKYTSDFSKWIKDSELEETVEKQITDTLADEIKAGISAYLDNSGATDYSVDVKVGIDSSDNISVDYIRVEILQDFDANQLIDFVKANYGEVPDLTVINKEKE